jgi:hypothetical protein
MLSRFGNNRPPIYQLFLHKTGLAKNYFDAKSHFFLGWNFSLRTVLKPGHKKSTSTCIFHPSSVGRSGLKETTPFLIMGLHPQLLQLIKHLESTILGMIHC